MTNGGIIMKPKIQKKTVSFINYELVTKFVADEANYRKMTESQVIEEKVLNAYLPINENGRMWIINYLYDENGTLQKALHAIYAYNGADMSCARYQNYLDIVKFTFDLTLQDTNNIDLSNDLNRLDYILKYMEMLEDRFRYVEKNCSNASTRFDMHEAAHMLKFLATQMSTSPDSLNGNFCDIYSLILAYWDEIKGWGSLYRLLQSLVDVSTWDTTSNRRYQLLNLIKQITDNWKSK